MRFLALLAVLPILSHAAPPSAPPAAVPAKVADTYAGVTVDDPFRSLEQLSSPDTLAWAKGQGAYARGVLDRLPGLAALRARVAALDAASSDRIFNIQRTENGQTFYLKRRPQDATPKLYVRDKAGAERVLFDPDEAKAQTGKPHAVSTYTAAPDGRHVALIVSAADAEVGAIRVLDTATGKQVGAPVEKIWGELAPAWLPDGKALVYSRSATGVFGKNQMVLRRLGSDGADDKPLLGYQIDSSFKSRDNDWLLLTMNHASEHVVLLASEGVNARSRVYVQPRSAFGKPDAAWREVVREEDNVRGHAPVGKWLYVRSFDKAPRFKLLRYDLSRPAAPPVEVVPQQAGVLEEMAVARDGVYYVVRTGAVAELFAMPHGATSAKAKKIALPKQGMAYLASADPLVDGVIFTLEPWTEPLSVLRVSLRQPVPADTGLIANRGAGFKDIVATETFCPARDGVKVPISILMKAGLPKNGNNPAILLAYGGYGMTITAAHSPTILAFLERGGILAAANPRGSGAYGEDWYQAGRGPTKANTWRDVIDCGEMLVREGYTSPAKLGVRGVSMGGVAAGRAMTERPDLFATAILQVGMLDAVRTITASQNGPNHLKEMGNVDTEAGIKQLLTMSSYHNVKDGTRYPAVLLTTGMNDNRVEPWMSFKMAARLQQANPDGKPVLLRIEEQGGHGVSTTADQRNALTADYLAFHLWQTGDPAFQPK